MLVIPLTTCFGAAFHISEKAEHEHATDFKRLKIALHVSLAKDNVRVELNE